jgi:hypothetical protein
MAIVEISTKLPDRAGALAAMVRHLAEHQINLAAITVDQVGPRSSVRMVVNDPKRAVPLLRKAKYSVTTRELLVVHLEDRSGSLLRVLTQLAEASINVGGLTILVKRDGTRVLVALAVDAPAKARKILRESGYYAPGAETTLSNSDLVAAAPKIPPESVGLLL